MVHGLRIRVEDQDARRKQEHEVLSEKGHLGWQRHQSTAEALTVDDLQPCVFLCEPGVVCVEDAREVNEEASLTLR